MALEWVEIVTLMEPIILYARQNQSVYCAAKNCTWMVDFIAGYLNRQGYPTLRCYYRYERETAQNICVSKHAERV